MAISNHSDSGNGRKFPQFQGFKMGPSWGWETVCLPHDTPYHLHHIQDCTVSGVIFLG